MIRQIVSVNHDLVKHLVKLRQNSRYRQEHQTVVIDGIKPVLEICCQYPAKVLLTYDESLIPKNVKMHELILVNESVMAKISGMVNPEGILAEVEMPKESSLENLQFIIALDGVADPGNMGALLRTALALRWQGAFILENSCDPFNEKALRASRGACFRLPLRHGSWKELKELMHKNQLTGIVADIEGSSPLEVRSVERKLLVLGNEAKGPSSKSLELCQRVSIPISAEMESLNFAAAGAILMYLLRG